MKTWRLVRGPDTDGPTQMAIDRAVLEARAASLVGPTVRLYRFEPAAVTIGRFQDAADVDLGWCADAGVDVARRPTGGRGVLHADELTYSMVAHCDDGVPTGTAASYRYLCAVLADAYQRLGVDAELTRRDRGGGPSGACYLHATVADLSLGAAKLSGGAQVWSEKTVLQHGSFVLSRDAGAEGAVFGLDEAAQTQLCLTTTTLADVLGERPTVEEIGVALVNALEETFGVGVVESSLSPWELERAEELRPAYDVQSVRMTDHQGIVQVEGV